MSLNRRLHNRQHRPPHKMQMSMYEKEGREERERGKEDRIRGRESLSRKDQQKPCAEFSFLSLLSPLSASLSSLSLLSPSLSPLFSPPPALPSLQIALQLSMLSSAAPGSDKNPIVVGMCKHAE